MLVLQIVLRLTTWLPIASNMQVEQGMAIGRFLLQRLTQPHTLNRDIGIISFISGLERSSFERLDGLGDGVSPVMRNYNTREDAMEKIRKLL